MSERSTKLRLLDAAEQLFSARGYAATSTRAIATAAEANSAAPNFHYGTKAGLYKAVLERRMRPLVARRMQLLARIAEDTTAPELGDLVDSVVLPLVEMVERGDPGEVSFLGLLARSTVTADPILMSLLSTELRDYSDRYVSAFARAMPHVDHDQLVLRILFMIGAISHAFTDSTRLELMRGSERTLDPCYVYGTLKAFLVAGLAA